MRKGYVWVEKNRVDSILKNGYFSVYSQLKHHVVTRKQLMEKYGNQFMKAKLKYPNCPKSLIGYLRWRAESRNGAMNGDKVIYFLYRARDAPKKFREGRVCIQLQWPSFWRVDRVLAIKNPSTKKLWLAGIPHALVHAPTGVIKHCKLHTPPPSGTR